MEKQEDRRGALEAIFDEINLLKTTCLDLYLLESSIEKLNEIKGKIARLKKEIKDEC